MFHRRDRSRSRSIGVKYWPSLSGFWILLIFGLPVTSVSINGLPQKIRRVSEQLGRLIEQGQASEIHDKFWPLFVQRFVPALLPVFGKELGADPEILADGVGMDVQTHTGSKIG